MIPRISGNTLLNNLDKTVNAQVTKTVSQKSDFDSYIKAETTTSDVYSNQSKETIESDDKKKNTKQQKQFVSQAEGNFFCTYLIDSEGNKILVNKVPISQGHLDASVTDFEKVKTEAAPYSKNNDPNLKQQINLEAAHKVNIQDMMEILKSYAGIPNQIDCKQQLKK